MTFIWKKSPENKIAGVSRVHFWVSLFRSWDGIDSVFRMSCLPTVMAKDLWIGRHWTAKQIAFISIYRSLRMNQMVQCTVSDWQIQGWTFCHLWFGCGWGWAITIPKTEVWPHNFIQYFMRDIRPDINWMNRRTNNGDIGSKIGTCEKITLFASASKYDRLCQLLWGQHNSSSYP